jgi:hypothetical protein
VDIMTTTVPVTRAWAPGERLQPWVVYDLERVAWIIEARAGELTEQERAIVRDAVTRIGRALVT